MDGRFGSMPTKRRMASSFGRTSCSISSRVIGHLPAGVDLDSGIGISEATCSAIARFSPGALSNEKQCGSLYSGEHSTDVRLPPHLGGARSLRPAYRCFESTLRASAQPPPGGESQGPSRSGRPKTVRSPRCPSARRPHARGQCLPGRPPMGSPAPTRPRYRIPPDERANPLGSLAASRRHGARLLEQRAHHRARRSRGVKNCAKVASPGLEVWRRDVSAR